MWSPRQALVAFFLCLLAASLLFGCRAFEPEAIEVNRLPETYIIGSPAETSGAYFHFHVYWYGTDADGFVERYVWALTDTSVQNYETDDDEEDQRFNPATNASTLEIGTYTTRTDTVFDFRIGQGSGLSYDMTLHMVAMDDQGAFDRTPARLHFFSNALGNPVVEFYRTVDGEEARFANFDTVAYGDPLFLRWSGYTPNLAAYDPALLAIRDTVPPFTDGLLGFKWRLPGEDDCNPSVQDCFNPKEFDEASGDSISVFGDVTQLTFFNEGSGDGVFRRRLDAGVIPLLVNTLDVAGVQVPTVNQLLNIKVNYEPDTHILDGEQDPVDAHNDPVTYPTYTVFHGPLAGTYSFTSGDTVPDRSYVTFKALGWDDARDLIVSDFNEMTFQGRFRAGQNVFGDGIFFSFETTFSDDHSTEEWLAVDDPADPLNASADTLGFQVGPFDYDVIMRAKDEHGTPDGSPDTLSFVGNFPPCVQCIELGRLDMTPAATYEDIAADNCDDGDCLDSEAQLDIYVDQGDPNYDPTDPSHLGWRGASAPTGNIWVNASAGTISFVEPAGSGWKALTSRNYHMIVYLHGKDHPMEHWAPGQAHERVKAWQYQVDYQGDPGNALADGGGRDNIRLLTGFDIQAGGNEPDPMISDLFIVPDTGVWGIAVQVSVPFLLTLSPETYWNTLLSPTQFGYDAPPRPDGGTDEEILAWQADPAVQLAHTAWMLTTAQFSPGQVSAIAVDQSTCAFRNESNMYHYYEGTRVPTPNGRRCQAGAYNQDPDPGGDPTGIIERGNLDLERFPAYSNDGVPVTKDFQITLKYGDGAEFVGGGDPPGWIGGKSRRVSLR